MKKNIVIGLIIILLIAGGIFLFFPKKSSPDTNRLMAEAVVLYADNLIKTENLPQIASSDFEAGSIYINNLIQSWVLLYEKTNELERSAGGSQISFALIDTVYAYDKEEIAEIFDNAPAGKKIKTLAKELNVSAERAFQLLKMSQAELTADAWNNAGDTFETLENSAKAIKDGCKVGLYVGGSILTGGATGGTAVLGEASAIIGGADLILEIGEDSANVYFGYNNQYTAVFSSMRKLSEPATTLIGFTTLDFTKMGGAINSTVFVFDQFNSLLSDDKIVGIKIDDLAANYTIESIVPEDIDTWFKANNLKKEPEKNLVLNNIKEIASTISVQTPKQTEKEVKIDSVQENIPTPQTVNLSDDRFVGNWYGYNFANQIVSTAYYNILPNGEGSQIFPSVAPFHIKWSWQDNIFIIDSPDFGKSYYSIIDADTLNWEKSIMLSGELVHPKQKGLVGSHLIRQ